MCYGGKCHLTCHTSKVIDTICTQLLQSSGQPCQTASLAMCQAKLAFNKSQRAGEERNTLEPIFCGQAMHGA